jgi:tetratricopeptide (TPR) repeat protein
MRQLFAAVCFILLLLPASGIAENKEIIAEGSYNMGDGETPTVAESRALIEAKKTALEQAGTYVESYTKVENLQLTKDEVQVLSSGIMEATVLDKRRTIVGEGIRFWVKIKARVSLDRVKDMAKKVKEKSVVEDYKKIREAYEKSRKEIEELKRQAAQAKGETEKKKAAAKIADEERLFQAKEWYEKGYRYALNNDNDKAIEAFTSAIALDPNFFRAYFSRGILYTEKWPYGREFCEKAIEDYSRAVALDPNDPEVYSSRGFAFNCIGKQNMAMEDFSRAIESYNKAIAANPNDAKAYSGRGSVNLNKKEHIRAIEDFSRAIALNPKDAEAYYGRGLAYSETIRLDRAIGDFNKAITLNPNNARAYAFRGVAYYSMRKIMAAVADFKKACDMGYKEGCVLLQQTLTGR